MCLYYVTLPLKCINCKLYLNIIQGLGKEYIFEMSNYGVKIDTKNQRVSYKNTNNINITPNEKNLKETIYIWFNIFSSSNLKK